MSQEFQQFLNSLLEEHQPATPAETSLVREMAHAHWRLQTVRRCQDRSLAAQALDVKLLTVLNRYAVTYKRTFSKSLETLKKLQLQSRQPFVSQKAEQPLSALGTDFAYSDSSRSFGRK